MKKAFVMLAAAAFVAVPVAGAHATDRIPSPVQVSQTGSCSTNYIPVAQAGNTVVCVYNYSMPSVRLTTTGCDAGETAYLVLNQYGACTS
jgi:hypothetical protein